VRTLTSFLCCRLVISHVAKLSLYFGPQPYITLGRAMHHVSAYFSAEFFWVVDSSSIYEWVVHVFDEIFRFLVS